ncbi:MAG: DNA repair protein RecN [Pyrinomonadaceae bacterium]|nr:DNA repair protein RecN [Pyrinomonadaceae bacterium]MBP6212923.1 DNA repair protein RecN [Pyrinomonadaceae bacterium]
MLSRLRIKNIALIDQLEIEFGDGLNLLTGETGSGKSIIVDSLGALTGERVYSELIKQGEASALIEGLFSLTVDGELKAAFDESGLEIDDAAEADLIVRRELSATGKNRIFVNDQMVTQAFLKRIGTHLVNIHGQGEQTALYDVSTHIEMLDQYAGNAEPAASTAAAYREWSAVKNELAELKRDDAEKLRLVDILRFQVDEIGKAGLTIGEDTELEEEKLRLNNVEKLSALSSDAYALLYEDSLSTLTTLERSTKKIAELAEYDSRFAEFDEGLASARAVIEEAAFAARDLMSHIEFSPERLEEIENRLAEMTRLKRKYGDSIETVLEHLADAQTRLARIETSDLYEQELKARLAAARSAYIAAATRLHEERLREAKKFEKKVIESLRDVALERAVFEVRVAAPTTDQLDGEDVERSFSANGFDDVEFYFSANPGESPRPLAKVASGGEASRLMLILKTAARAVDAGSAAVFDEVDVGIGGRVAEAVGRKLKELAATQQVLCVTHQAQIASLADRHYVVDKQIARDKTTVGIRELASDERVEEIARMLAGEQITEAARENARAMLAGSK